MAKEFVSIHSQFSLELGNGKHYGVPDVFLYFLSYPFPFFVFK